MFETRFICMIILYRKHFRNILFNFSVFDIFFPRLLVDIAMLLRKFFLPLLFLVKFYVLPVRTCLQNVAF